MEPAAGSKQSPPMGTGMAPGSSLCAPHFLAGALHTTKNPPKTNPPPPKTGHAEQASPARNDVSLFSDGKEMG